MHKKYDRKKLPALRLSRKRKLGKQCLFYVILLMFTKDHMKSCHVRVH